MKAKPWILVTVPLFVACLSVLLVLTVAAPPMKTVDACRFADLGKMDLRETRGADYQPERLHWSVAKNFGLAFHVRESDLWFALPMAIESTRRTLPLIAIEGKDIRPADPAWLAKIGRGEILLCRSDFGDVRVDRFTSVSDRQVHLDLEDRYQRLSGSFALHSCLTVPDR